MKEISRFDVLSLGKMQGFLMGLIGAIFGIIYAFFFAFSIGFSTKSVLLGIAAFFGFLILIPVFYGVFGFLGGLLGGALYNWAAKKIGGIKIEIGESKK